MPDLRINPSILSADFARLAEEPAATTLRRLGAEVAAGRTDPVAAAAEMLACAQAGIPFEVVPGVAAAVASATSTRTTDLSAPAKAATSSSRATTDRAIFRRMAV